jgi:hypothetical protein
MKPHPSFFLKVMFNFLSLQHYILYVKGNGMEGESLKVVGALCVLLEEKQRNVFLYGIMSLE